MERSTKREKEQGQESEAPEADTETGEEKYVREQRSVDSRSIFRAIWFMVGFQALGDFISSMIAINMNLDELGGSAQSVAAAVITALVIYASMAVLGAEETYIDKKTGEERPNPWWRRALGPFIWFFEMQVQVQLFVFSFMVSMILYTRSIFVYEFFGWSVLRQLTLLFSNVWVFIAVKLRKDARLQIPTHRQDWSVGSLVTQPMHDTIKEMYFYRCASLEALYDDTGKKDQ